MQYKKSCTILVFVEHFRLLGAITGSVWHLPIQLEWGALSGDVVLRLLFFFPWRKWPAKHLEKLDPFPRAMEVPGLQTCLSTWLLCPGAQLF